MLKRSKLELYQFSVKIILNASNKHLSNNRILYGSWCEHEIEKLISFKTLCSNLAYSFFKAALAEYVRDIF